MNASIVTVNDTQQKNYHYVVSAPPGQAFDPEFKPQLTPTQMLELGVFGGYYLHDCQDEFPKSWFERAKLSYTGHNPHLNFFGVKASQPLAVWQKKGWIFEEDPRGWFQWYCRYYMGRRLPQEDHRQIQRWRAIRRHCAQITKNCVKGDLTCRPRQRQALLHWAYDSRQL